MKPKEIQEKLGINADRIKFFKREGVLSGEKFFDQSCNKTIDKLLRM